MMFSVMMFGWMHHDLYAVFHVPFIKKCPILQNYDNTLEVSRIHPTSYVMNGKIIGRKCRRRSIPKLQNSSCVDILEDIYYPGENIPEWKLKRVSELSHGVLRRRLSQEEYKKYRELLHNTISIFNDNDIR